MKRRSFLGLVAGLVSTPVAAKAGHSFFKESPGANDPHFGIPAPDCGDAKFCVSQGPGSGIFTISTVDGQPTICVRGDLIADGTITVKSFTTESLSAVTANFSPVNSGVLRA